MKTSRREFLKALGIGGAVLAVNPFSFIPEINKYGNFDRREEYGDSVKFTAANMEDRDVIKSIVGFLEEEMCAVIPQKYRKHVSYSVITPNPTMSDPLAQIGHCVWKYVPNYHGKKIKIL